MEYNKTDKKYEPNQTYSASGRNPNGTGPFLKESRLEIEARKTGTQNGVSVDKAGVICTFFICDLPFDC